MSYVLEMESNGGRSRSGKFRAGHAGGPGRPKGYAAVARQILAATEDGAELVQFALAVFRDPTQGLHARVAMHAWLSDRALGKPHATLEIGTSDGVPALPSAWDQMSVGERERWLDTNVVLALGPGND